MRKSVIIALFVLLLAACQPSDDDNVVIPTLAVLPSITPSPTLTDSPTPTVPTATNTATNTPTPSNTPTVTLTPTATLTPSRTPIPSETPDATGQAIGTSTAVVLEAPRFSTFTPLPPGIVVLARPTSTGTPQVVADVVITQQQLQEEVDLLLQNQPGISQVNVRIESEGVLVNLTAQGDQAFITGTFLIHFDLSVGGFNNIVIARPVPPDEFVMQDGNEPPEAFVSAAHGAATEAVFEAFDFILNQRLGEGQHDLEFIRLVDGRMEISLLVPKPD